MKWSRTIHSKVPSYVNVDLNGGNKEGKGKNIENSHPSKRN